MVTVLLRPRPTVVTGLTSASSKPLRGPAVTTRRGDAGSPVPPWSAVASPHPVGSPRAAASKSGEGPPGLVRSGHCAPAGPRRCSGLGVFIRFTVSLDPVIRLRRSEMVPRLAPAAGRIVSRKMKQHLPPGLLRPVLLAVSLEPRGAEEEPAAMALQIALALVDQPPQLRAQRLRIREPIEVGAALPECLPGVVEVPGSDALLLKLAPATVVRCPSSSEGARG